MASLEDHPRDFHPNRPLRGCQVRGLAESHAREAERLRTATGRPTAINAIDAVVATFASACPRPDRAPPATWAILPR